MKKYWPDFGAILFFLILVLFFFHQFLAGQNIFTFRDLSSYFYPLRFLMVEQVKSGLLPLWNPYIFCGYPFLATLQVGFFNPLALIYYFLPFTLAFNYHLILHYFLAASFMYFCLKHFNLSWPASFFGGLLFAFSGYLISVYNFPTSLSSTIWLPLAFLFSNRLSKNFNFFNIGGLALFLALIFLGGEPTIIYITFFFLVAYGLTFSQKKLKTLAGLLLALALASGLTAIQFLPFLELVKFSDRIYKYPYEMLTFRSFPPQELLNFAFPFFFGNQLTQGDFLAQLFGRNYQEWLISPYLGIIPLFFVFFAFQKNKKLSWFLTASLIFGLLLAFGNYTPVYKIIFKIPVISLIRYPAKYLFLVNFCLVILASFGFQALLEFFNSQKELFKIFLIALASTTAAALIFIATSVFRNQIFLFLAQHFWPQAPGLQAKLAEIMESNLISLFAAVLYFGAITTILFFGYKNKISKFYFVFLVLILVGGDLFIRGSAIIFPSKPFVLKDTPESIKILLKDRSLFRFFCSPEIFYKSFVISGANYDAALFETKDTLSGNWPLTYHLQNFFGYESIKPFVLLKRYFTQFDEKNLAKNLDLLSFYNVKYLALTQKTNCPSLVLLREKPEAGFYLYQNKKVRPRAFIINSKNQPEEEETKIIKYRPDEVEISTRLARPGFLFLSDSFYPGWQVWVDGVKSEILPAEQIFRKVKLEPGQHLVKFVYNPLSFKIGAGISGATILAVLLIYLALVRKSSV